MSFRRTIAHPWVTSPIAWTLFVLLLMLRDTLFVRAHSWVQIPWIELAGSELGWTMWGLLTPCVLAFTRRFRISASAPRHIWLCYAGAAALATVLQIAGETLELAAWARLFGIHAPFGSVLAMTALTRWPFDLLIFAGIVAVAQAVWLRREAATFALHASQLEARLAEARLGALKSQVHPHFLFNSLHAVAALIVKNQNQAALETLSRLSDFLRIVLDHAEMQKVSLKEELDLLRLYLDIQQIRFGDRLHVRVDVPPELLSTEVPYLLLQPLVENAIKHGVEKYAPADSVEIRAWQDIKGIHLLVKNGGALTTTANGVPRERIGLGNTRERLQLLYGERQLVDIRPDPDGGVVVEIVLPASEPPQPAPVKHSKEELLAR